MFFHIILITSTARNDLEQLNSYDKISLREDESSFTTIPSSLPERKPLFHGDMHARNTYNSGPPFFHKRHGHHGHHNHGDHSYHNYSHHSHHHVDHKPHQKDSFGNHVYITHYTNHNKIIPDKDMFVAYDSMHYPRFPFKGRQKENEYEHEPEITDDDKLESFASFH